VRLDQLHPMVLTQQVAVVDQVDNQELLAKT
jgi:hypothetical protein